MDYNDCARIVDATEKVFENTPYVVRYGLDGDPYIEYLDGSEVDYFSIPRELTQQFEDILETLNIDY